MLEPRSQVLTFTQLKTPLIGHIDLGVAPGACSTLSGPFGAGNSLIVRAVANLNRNTGPVMLNNLPRSHTPTPEPRPNIPYVQVERGW